jgi:hypothetical protein
MARRVSNNTGRLDVAAVRKSAAEGMLDPSGNVDAYDGRLYPRRPLAPATNVHPPAA